MAIISNSIQNNTSNSGSTTVSRTQVYRSGNSAVRLQEGQTLKGVVSDVHGNQITLSMEDGSSFTGKLPDASQYSIGQKAAFQIVSLDSNTIYMKAVSGAYLLDMEDTIEQALEEASLPKSDRNLEVVRSLLQNQQSISRENIMSAIRLCANYPDANVDSVITMRRLGLPMSEDTVKQFDSYQNNTHQLLYKMDSLTDSVNEMLNSIGSQIPRLAKSVGTQLLNIALQGNPSPEEQAVAENSLSETTSETMGEAAADEVSADSTEQSKMSPSPSETAEESAAAATEQETNTAASSGPLSRMKQLFTSISGTVSGSSAEPEQTKESTPFIHEQAGFLLSGEERQEFSSFLSDYPLSDKLKEGIADGTITARNFLEEIKNAFPNMTEEQAGKLLASKGFQTFVKQQFLTGWTLSPEQLKADGSPESVYQKMSRQFDELSTFSEKVLGKDVFSQLSDNASDLKQNLDFMKTLNETFQYIQLPLKMQSQNAHGDLYVMTRKESLKKDPNNLKVLLHLDMDHLGTLDIHITKENTSVSTQFYVSTEETKHLLEKNIQLLHDAINEQGYSFSSQLSLKEKDMDVVNDFIAADAPVGNIARYNFDLRA